MVLTLIIANIIKLLELGNHHARKSEIHIITEDDPLFVREEDENDLVAEITFNIKDLKIYWIKRLPEGYIIVRMLEKSIEIVKDLNMKTTIDIDYSNIDKTSEELLK